MKVLWFGFLEPNSPRRYLKQTPILNVITYYHICPSQNVGGLSTLPNKYGKLVSEISQAASR